MEHSELTEAHFAAIRRFVGSPEFIEIKDSFVSHTPERGGEGREGDSDSKNLGKLLGTRFVFNKLEELAKKMPQQRKQDPSTKRDQVSRRDPDLS